MPTSIPPTLVRANDPSALTNKTIRYTPGELKGILHAYEDQHDHWYKVMPINAIKSIGNLRLNHKRRRYQYTSQKRKANPLCRSGPKLDKLIKIKKLSHKNDVNITFATCNTQSIRNKDLQVSDLLDDYSIDVLALNETWLTNKETDFDSIGLCTLVSQELLSRLVSCLIVCEFVLCPLKGSGKLWLS